MGSVAVTRRGSHFLITGFRSSDKEHPVITYMGGHGVNGRYGAEESLNDIIKVIRDKS